MQNVAIFYEGKGGVCPYRIPDGNLCLIPFQIYLDATNLARAKAKADSDYYAAVKASESNKASTKIKKKPIVSARRIPVAIIQILMIFVREYLTFA